MSLRAKRTANVAEPDPLLEEEQAEIIDGLKAVPKRIAPKYFYDQRGSELFNKICALPEYYLTRTESMIMAKYSRDIAARIGPHAAVIEFGAGSNAKAKHLLSQLESPVAYVPVEISGEYLLEQANDLQLDFPDLSIKPVVADFTKPFDLPPHAVTPERNLIFFPGSTIGNFTRDEALDLLRVMRGEAKSGGALLIGVDLIKNHSTVSAAYNDSQGVTAEFNRNALHHINEGLGATFQPELFRHEAIYDTKFDRIEMRLRSVKRHAVDVAGQAIEFESGEHIVTEYSQKYSVKEFAALAESAGWVHETVWSDAENLFSVHYLSVA
jgi:L-histidine N-alpha-methyltransferase